MATEAKYQSMYFNPDAEAEDRLIFHDPIFDDPTTGIMALKSTRLEDMDGMVLLGSQQTLRMLREKVKEKEFADEDTTLDFLADLIKEMNLEVIYTQGKFKSIEPRLDPEIAEGAAKPTVFYKGHNLNDDRRIKTGHSDWDSYTFCSDSLRGAKMYGEHITTITAKPGARIIYEGTTEFRRVCGGWVKGETLLSYASRSALSAKKAGYDAIWFRMQTDVGTAIFNMNKFTTDKDEEIKASLVLANRRLHKKPSLSNKPGNLNDFGKGLWKDTMREYKDLLKTVSQPRDQWDVALNLITEKSSDLGQTAFDTQPREWNENFTEEIIERDLKAQAESAYTIARLQKVGLLSTRVLMRKFSEIKRVNDGIWITTLQSVKVAAMKDMAEVMDFLRHRLSYKLIRGKNPVATKIVAAGSSVTICENEQGNSIEILISHRLQDDDLRSLVGDSKNPEKDLGKKWGLWVKSGKKSVLKAIGGADQNRFLVREPDATAGGELGAASLRTDSDPKYGDSHYALKWENGKVVSASFSGLTQDDEDEISGYQTEGGDLDKLEVMSKLSGLGDKRMSMIKGWLESRKVKQDRGRVLLYRGQPNQSNPLVLNKPTSMSYKRDEAVSFGPVVAAWVPLASILLVLDFRDLLYESRDVEYKEGGAREDEAEVWVAPGKYDVDTTETTAGLSPLLFHWTSLDGAASILETDKFKLSTHVGTKSDNDKNNKKFYYMSTSRVPNGGYTKPYGVILVLDGKKLSQNYSGTPFDYWGEEWRNRSGKDRNQYEENEDRILADKPTIPQASKYIDEIHVMYKGSLRDDPSPNDEEFNNAQRKRLRAVLYTAKKKNIPVFFYEDKSAFLLLNKKKTIDPPFEEWKIDHTLPSWSKSDRDTFGPWLEVYYTTDYNKLTKEGKRKRETLRYSDAPEVLRTDLHNARKTGEAANLLALWKKLKISTADEYIAILRERQAKKEKAAASIVGAAEDQLWYHGRTANSKDFSFEHVGHGHDADGPGFYFTSDYEDAAGYTQGGKSGGVMTVRLTPRKLVSGKAKPAEVKELIERADNYEARLLDFNDEGDIDAAVKTIVNYNITAVDSFQEVCYRFYRGYQAEYLQSLIAMGYDGHLGTKVHKYSSTKHMIIYNPKVIHVEDDNFVKGAHEADAGVKAFLKGLATSLIGLTILSQSAFGFHLKDPKGMAKVSQEGMLKLAKHLKQDHNYKVDVKEGHKDKHQTVRWSFKKDGKEVGYIVFAGGDKDDVQDGLEFELTKDGQTDEVVKDILEVQFDAIKDAIGQDKGWKSGASVKESDARVSDTVYHFTSVKSAAEILLDNAFKLTPWTSSEADSKGKRYFLSTTRSKLGAYHREGGIATGVIFVLDGTKLNNNFKGIPTDFYQQTSPGSSGKYSDEMEDRVVSDKPDIKPLAKYVKEIHLCAFFGSTGGNKVFEEATRLKIPVFVYRAGKTHGQTEKWKALDKSAAALNTPKFWLASDKQYKRDGGIKHSNMLRKWLATYKAVDEANSRADIPPEVELFLTNNFLSKSDKNCSSNIERSMTSERLNGDLEPFVEMLKREDWQAIDFVKYLRRSWQDLPRSAKAALDSKWRMLTDEEVGQEYQWEYSKQRSWTANAFPDVEAFRAAVKAGQPKRLTRAEDAKIDYRSHCLTIESLKDLTSGYQFPRDVDRIVKGLESGAALPYPIVLSRDGKLRVMSGNTRLDAAFILGYEPEVLIVEV